MLRATLVVFVLGSLASAASAGTYVGLGLGSGPSVSDADGRGYQQDGRSWRALLGYRIGRLSIEGAYTDYSSFMQSVAEPVEAQSLQVAGKYSYPLGNNFEVFGRAGLIRTWLSAPTITVPGDGYTLSAGFEYRLDLILAGASAFVDYTRNTAAFDDGTNKLDQTASMWTLGFTVSL